MRFTYLGGTEFDKTELPAAVTMFGIKFIEGVPKDVLPGDFADNAKYQHALAKLRGNKFFTEVDDREGAVEVLDAPKKRRSRKPEVVEFENPIVEDAPE